MNSDRNSQCSGSNSRMPKSGIDYKPEADSEPANDTAAAVSAKFPGLTQAEAAKRLAADGANAVADAATEPSA